jgi:tetratricopeptide (TPR) repeat protein
MTGMTRAAVVALTLLPGSTVAAEQAAAPTLTRQQRAALQAVVTAVDRAAAAANTPGLDWPVHLLRASDGSHYVAFSIVAPPGMTATRPVTLYVRLARRPTPGQVVAERSAVAEWLAGRRNTPLPPERGIAFGEMPIYGAGAIASRAQPSQSLRLLEMERERAEERRAERERDRKAALEGEAARAAHPLLPFEDFDMQAAAVADASGALALQRSFTAGPGEYDLIVGWTDPAAKDPLAAATVVKRALRLPIASTTEFALSSVIVADEVTLRDRPYGPDQQTAHPYSIGVTEIVPARDHVLTNDEKLALVFQVINPRAAPDGKPDVAVGFRLYRVIGERQESVGVLSPQIYNQLTLPVDFDVAKGHPIFAAVQVPLKTFKRGIYRMQIVAEDRLGGLNTSADATFTVTGSPAALLADAPRLGPPFRREALLTGAALEALVGRLQSASPSPGYAATLQAARERRFADLVREAPVMQEEQGLRAALRALTLYALGDTPTAVAVSLRQAAQLGAPAATLQMIRGAAHALEGNDRDAITAWQEATAGGINAAATALLLIDAHLRQGNQAAAIDIGKAALASAPDDEAVARRLAAAYIAAGQITEAVSLLDQRLQRRPDDAEAQWLMLHALFAQLMSDETAGTGAASRQRFKQLATAYIAAGGQHAALAKEWAELVK